MNIKQFYLIKACEKLPQDVTGYIWKLIKDDAANKIASIYFKKVAINVNFFKYLLNFDVLSCSLKYNLSPFCMKVKILSTVNRVVKNNMYKITYKYIQEPGTWIEKLEDMATLDSWQTVPTGILNVNNIYFMINSVKNGNEIYRNTGIEWWENF
tara:strand:+ start:3321 stop:3782 length:462 start_codon:yes stop_codon:yes gene_type:complete